MDSAKIHSVFATNHSPPNMKTLNKSSTRFGRLASLPLLALVGCAGAELDYPDTSPVAGVVTLDGQPVADASVVFAPTSHQHTATAKTDEQGRYQLTSFGAVEGAVPGPYGVMIIKTELVYPPGTSPPSPTQGDGDGDDEDDGGPSPKEVSLIPEQYGKIATSGLTATVAEGENEFNFDL